MGGGLNEAMDALRERYGKTPRDEADGSWRLLVAVITEHERPASASDTAGTNSTLLESPAEVAAAEVEAVSAALGRVPRAAQKGAILRSLAEWWVRRFGDETSPDWGRDVESLRGALRRVRGVNLELADRVLLFVAGLPAYPVGRSAMRVVCRHGWLGPDAEYEEWQSQLLRVAGEAGADPRDVADWMGVVGREFCGPQPKCRGCPLEPLLPPGGPYEPE